VNSSESYVYNMMHMVVNCLFFWWQDHPLSS